MEIIQSMFFYIISLITIVSALSVIFARKIVYSAVALIVTFLSISGIFFLLNADFVAISQIIIYAVGIIIVLLFAIMLTGTKSDEKLWIAFAPRTIIALFAAFCLFLAITFAVTAGFKSTSEKSDLFTLNDTNSPKVMESISTIPKEGTAPIIGKSLLTTYVLPFELLSILLLATIFGTVVIARRNEISPVIARGEATWQSQDQEITTLPLVARDDNSTNKGY